MSEVESPATQTRKELIAYLEKVITEGMVAEFAAYMSLPSPDTSMLSPYFAPNSPAMQEIKNVVQRIAQRGWHLRNQMNPSTMRLLSIVVKKIDKFEAIVGTREYWYLRWWDHYKEKYTYPYRETNRQTYVVKNIKGNWKIYQNIRPNPRTSQPGRWKHRR